MGATGSELSSDQAQVVSTAGIPTQSKLCTKNNVLYHIRVPFPVFSGCIASYSSVVYGTLKKKKSSYVNTNQNLPHSVVDVFFSYLQHDIGPVMLIL